MPWQYIATVGHLSLISITPGFDDFLDGTVHINFKLIFSTIFLIFHVVIGIRIFERYGMYI